MIEIEKKFILTENQQRDLLDGAQMIHEKNFKDTYFDDDDYRLTTNDLWLRRRDETYELKCPTLSGSGDKAGATRFNEIDSQTEIINILKLDVGKDLETNLVCAGIKKFMTCITNRKSYQKDGFHIDIDSATYEDSDFTHAVAEIELLISDESKIDIAESQIIDFAKKFNLFTDQIIFGKVAAYLKSEKPNHYLALVKAGILK